METMKAAVFRGAEGWCVLDLPKPKVEPGTIVLRVRASGICGSDLARFRDPSWTEKLPSGHEVAGEVAETGEGVEGLRAGDRVAVEAVAQGRACGRCRFCLAGQYRRCLTIGNPRLWAVSGWGGGFAQYLKRKAWACYKLPDRVSWEEGALVEPVAVSVHGVRRGQLRGGETVVVIGTGTIGLTAVAVARSLGARRVFATARYQQQRDMALKLGADAVFPPDGKALSAAVMEATGGVGADMSIETVGGADNSSLMQAMSVLRGQGRVVCLGKSLAPAPVDLLYPFMNELSLIWAQCYSIVDAVHDFEIAVDIVAGSGMPFKEMVTHTFPLLQAREALATALDKSSGCIKVQLKP